jgi:hypothetical protein
MAGPKNDWPEKDEPRPQNTAGARRRVIEGEGLGGFARRLTHQFRC